MSGQQAVASLKTISCSCAFQNDFGNLFAWHSFTEKKDVKLIFIMATNQVSNVY